jgi:hypothetical protein
MASEVITAALISVDGSFLGAIVGACITVAVLFMMLERGWIVSLKECIPAECLWLAVSGWQGKAALSIGITLWGLPKFLQFLLWVRLGKILQELNLPTELPLNPLSALEPYGIYAIVILLIWGLFDQLVKHRKQIKDARLKLSKLRKKGIVLRNDANRKSADYVKVIDEASVSVWLQLADKWNQDVIREISKINEADAELFKTLDVILPPIFPLANQPQIQDELATTFEQNYNIHSYRIVRLTDMVHTLWREIK